MLKACGPKTVKDLIEHMDGNVLPTKQLMKLDLKSAKYFAHR